MTPFFYRCRECGKIFQRDEVRYLCDVCGKFFRFGEPLHGVLEVFSTMSTSVEIFTKANPDWQLFSAVEKQYYPEYPVGNTPFSRAPRLAGKTGLQKCLD